MGLLAILITWPEPFEQYFVPLSNGSSTWNLALIGQMVSEKMFENGGRAMDACPWYKLIHESNGSGGLMNATIDASLVMPNSYPGWRKISICTKQPLFVIFLAYPSFDSYNLA